MSNKEYTYFELAVSFGRRVLGAVGKYQYFSANMFGAVDTPVLATVVWSTPDGSFIMVHTACANVLRMKLGCEADDLPSYFKLCEFEIVLGFPMNGADGGRLKDVQYETVGDCIDLSPFWHPGNDEGQNVFDYKAPKDAGMDWLLARPDVFPRFFKELKPEPQLAYSEDTAPERTDRLTTMPMDILHVLIRHLPPQSYVRLMGTCRFLRYHALTTFQPHAQSMVRSLGWAIASDKEMNALSPSMRSQLTRANDEPGGEKGESYTQEGDWDLYLSHVHRTKSMRARRWIWALADEVKRVYDEKRPGSIFGDDYSTGVQDPKKRQKQRKEHQSMVRQIFQMGQVPGMKKMSTRK